MRGWVVSVDVASLVVSGVVDDVVVIAVVAIDVDGAGTVVEVSTVVVAAVVVERSTLIEIRRIGIRDR